MAPSQHCWRQHGDVSPHQPSLHPQPGAPGTPWQPRDKRQKRGFVPGEGEAREGIQEAAPSPRNSVRLGDTPQPPEPGCPGAVQSWLGSPRTPVHPPIPAGPASCPSEVPSSLNPRLDLKPSPCPGQASSPCSTGFLWAPPRTQESEDSLPSPSTGELTSQLHLHVGDLGGCFLSEPQFPPSVKCRA